MTWLGENWADVFIPILVLLAIYAVGLWVRAILYRYFGRWTSWKKWRGRNTVADTIRLPFIVWFLMLGAYVATQISVLSPDSKSLAARIIGSLFVLYFGWVTILISEKLINLYASGAKIPSRTISVALNVMRVTVVVIAILIVLSIWGAPVNPILLVIAVIVFVAGLALRDAIPNYVLGMQVSSSKQIKPGDFIKLESGESG